MNQFLQRLKEHAVRYPERIAVSDGREKLTYSQMMSEAGRVCHYLQSENIGREDRVQLVLKRSIHFIPCIIGVFRAGACLIALEADYPAERIEYIYKDAQCRLRIDDVLLERILQTVEPAFEDALIQEHDAAYIAYTSGSTGTPKGVVHEYGNIDQQVMCFAPRDDYPEFRRGFVPPFFFVAAIMQMIDYLSNGESVYIVSRALLRDLNGLLSFIEEMQLQGIYLSPSYLRLCDPSKTSLEIVQTGSEPANGICSPGGRPKIINVYSMSECGFELLHQILDRPYDPAPVGKPVLDVDVHLVDDEGRRVEGPGTGELCFKNEYVRGYLNLPELNEKAFRDGYYYTGDLARRDAEGRYYIVGRKDDMIKINGNRIEPAEIEKQVEMLTGLKQVVAKGFQIDGRTFITVYYLNEQAQALGILKNGALSCDLSRLRSFLPEYMLPAYYVGLEAFPLNPNGKLSRRDLLPPALSAVRKEYTAPKGEPEKTICSLFSEVLGVSPVGIDDDFYLIGGDSLKTMQFCARCGEIGITMDFKTLYDCRTPRKVAEHWTKKVSEADLEKEEKAAFLKSWPLLEGQQLHAEMQMIAPESPFLNVPALYRLKPEVDIQRLKTALEQTVHRHPVLNVRLRKENDVWTQQYCGEYDTPVEILSVSQKMLDELKNGFGSSISGDHDLARPLAIEGKLYRFAILCTEEARYLYVNFHHVNCDGTSMHLILDEICHAYTGREDRILPDYYFTILTRLKEQKENKAAVEEAWKEYDHIMGDSSAWRDRPIRLRMDAELAGLGSAHIGEKDFLDNAPGHNDAFVITALLLAMAEYNGNGEAMICTVRNGRTDALKASSAGFIARYIPIYLRLDEGLTPLDHLRRTGQQIKCLTAHPELDLPIKPGNDYFGLIRYNNLGRLLGLGEISLLTDEYTDMRVFDVNPGLISFNLWENENGMRSLEYYYTESCYNENGMKRYIELVKKAIRVLDEAESKRKD